MLTIRNIINGVVGILFLETVSVLYDIHVEQQLFGFIKQYEGQVLPIYFDDEIKKYSVRVDRLENEIQIVRFRHNWRILKVVHINFSVQFVMFMNRENIVKNCSGTYWPTLERFQSQ